QRTLADEVTLDVALARLRAALAGRLGVDDLVLVARDETGLVIAGGERVAPGSLVARVLETGASEFVRVGRNGAGARGILSRAPGVRRVARCGRTDDRRARDRAKGRDSGRGAHGARGAGCADGPCPGERAAGVTTAPLRGGAGRQGERRAPGARGARSGEVGL